MERTGMSVFLMLCTLNFIILETDDEIQNTIQTSPRVHSEAVRKAIFTPDTTSSSNLVMLIGITQEN
mgnify:CR=1 FL=1